jgi:hypothetical protein
MCRRMLYSNTKVLMFHICRGQYGTLVFKFDGQVFARSPFSVGAGASHTQQHVMGEQGECIGSLFRLVQFIRNNFEHYRELKALKRNCERSSARL